MNRISKELIKIANEVNGFLQIEVRFQMYHNAYGAKSSIKKRINRINRYCGNCIELVNDEFVISKIGKWGGNLKFKIKFLYDKLATYVMQQLQSTEIRDDEEEDTIFDVVYEILQYLCEFPRSHYSTDDAFGNLVIEVKSIINNKHKTNQKYTLHHKEGNLWRIQAVKDFDGVSKGQFGGLIESQKNLSEKGNCWVYEEGKVYGNAVVQGDAAVQENSQVYGNAILKQNAQTYGNAKVYGNAIVFGQSQVFDDAQVYGNAKVGGYSLIGQNAKVYGKAQIYDYETDQDQEVIE